MPFHHNELGTLRALVVCLGGQDVVIDGEGTIDLNGSSFYDFSSPIVPESRVPFTQAQKAECTVKHSWRPSQSIFFYQVKNLTVKGITVLDAPCWTFSFNECQNVKVLGLTIDTNLNVPNDDGIHVCGCDGVIISDCHISTGDDCIAISGITDWARPCGNIVITNCVLRSCSKAIVIGYIYSHIRNVLIDNVIIRESNRGLCFMCNDQGGLVENVQAANMVIDTRVRSGNWWGNGEPIFFMGVKHDYHIPADQNPHRETPGELSEHCDPGRDLRRGERHWRRGHRKQLRERDAAGHHHGAQALCQFSPEGNTFDLAPGRMEVEVPEDCSVYLKGAAGVTVQDMTLIPFNGREQRVVAEP